MNNTQKLFTLAVEAAKNAYCPYSKFAVGAAIRADDDKIYNGCNVENISYPVGTCAEAGAIAAMIAGGGRKIKEMLIYADSKQLISPCGACRQRISEFAEANVVVYLANAKGIQKSVTVADLLPCGFAEF